MEQEPNHGSEAKAWLQNQSMAQKPKYGLKNNA